MLDRSAELGSGDRKFVVEKQVREREREAGLVPGSGEVGVESALVEGEEGDSRAPSSFFGRQRKTVSGVHSSHSTQQSPAGQAMFAWALLSAQSQAEAAGRESASGGLPVSSFITEAAQASRGADPKSTMRSSARARE